MNADTKDGCEYCKNGKEIFGHNQQFFDILLTIDGCTLTAFRDDEEYEPQVNRVQINFCPICGRKLKE